jgi:drug/metabolite transporter (DMT)-like permease
MFGWGTGVFLMKLATRGIDPWTAVAFNLPGYLLAAVWLLPWVKPGLTRYHLAAVAVGAAYVIGNFAFYKLVKHQPISIAAPLASLYVVIPLVAGLVLLAERPTRLQWCGIALAAVAILMLTWPSNSADRSGTGPAERQHDSSPVSQAPLET